MTNFVPVRPRSISDERVATLLRCTLKSKTPAGTHWSIRQAAEVNRLSKSTVHQVFQTFALQPYRSKKIQTLHRSRISKLAAPREQPEMNASSAIRRSEVCCLGHKHAPIEPSSLDD
jgi:hypothetical protein